MFSHTSEPLWHCENIRANVNESKPKSDHYKAPEITQNHLTFLKSVLNPTLTLSAYLFPIPCSWILFLSPGLTWITRELSMLYLLGVHFILLNFLFISLLCFYPVCTVPRRRYRQIAYWSFWMLSENPKISFSPFTLLRCLSPSLWFLHR